MPDKNTTTIREISDENREQVEKLDGNSEFLPNPRELLRNMAHGRNAQARAIYCDDKLIGFALWDDHESGIMLRGFMFDVKYQKKGFAKSALNQLLSAIKAQWGGRGPCEIWIIINKRESIMKKICENVGFTLMEPGYLTNKYVVVM